MRPVFSDGLSSAELMLCSEAPHWHLHTTEKTTLMRDHPHERPSWWKTTLMRPPWWETTALLRPLYLKPFPSYVHVNTPLTKDQPIFLTTLAGFFGMILKQANFIWTVLWICQPTGMSKKWNYAISKMITKTRLHWVTAMYSNCLFHAFLLQVHW